MTIKLTIADDHPVVLKGLQQILEDYKDISIVDICTDGDILLRSLRKKMPNVLLLDLQMPGKDGFELTKLIKKKYPNVAILVLTNTDILFQVKSVLKNGAKGFLLKSATPEVLVKAIEIVHSGMQFIDPEIAQKLRQESEQSNNEELALTKREKEILLLIAQGQTSQQIASKLFLSQRTVENHRFNILDKLSVNNSAELIKKAILFGLIK